MEKIIWNSLLDLFKNPYGVAALMGNLYVESKLNPHLLENKGRIKYGITSDEYTDRVDKGIISKEKFVEDGFGYGLVQWTFWSRKERLYEFAKSVNKSIGDLDMQILFMSSELCTYPTVIEAIRNAVEVPSCCEIITRRYEKPAVINERTLKTRADAGIRYYNLFVGHTEGKVIVTTDKTNIREGNDKKYKRLGMAMAGDTFDWIATSVNNWHAVQYNDKVAWISGEFSKKG